MIGNSDFGPDFQRVLIRTCLDDPALRDLVGRYVRAGQLGFTDPASAWAWRVMGAHANPNTLVIQTEARSLQQNDPAHTGIQAILTADDFRSFDYTRSAIVEWARRQTFQMAFNEAVGQWNAGSHEGAMETMLRRMEEVDQIKLEDVDRGWFFEELELRQSERMFVSTGLDAFALGIKPIDERMHGGLSFGELEIPFAYTGIGKTFYCVHRGFVAVRQRRKVLHFVLEGGRPKTQNRYEARFSELLYSEVRRGDIDPATMAKLHRHYSSAFRHGLVLRGMGDNKAWKASIYDITGELDDLRRAHGWVPELVIVDYGDLLAAEGDTDREVQKNAFRQLKTLAERITFRGHRGYAICSPSQAIRPTKGVDDKPHVLKPEDIADCYEKARIADALVSINRTDWEHENNRARLYLGKYRDNADHLLVRIQTDYARGALAVLGVPEPPDLPPRPHP